MTSLSFKMFCAFTSYQLAQRRYHPGTHKNTSEWSKSCFMLEISKNVPETRYPFWSFLQSVSVPNIHAKHSAILYMLRFYTAIHHYSPCAPYKESSKLSSLVNFMESLVFSYLGVKVLLKEVPILLLSF